MRMIKPVIEYIISPLTHIINSCIRDQSFPHAWNVALISPVPKIHNPTINEDYRPVSILSVLSKVHESLVLRQMHEFINNFALYKETQRALRKGHSTTTTLLKFKDDITKAMKRDEITLAVFADYSEAFDTVDFRLLNNKLHNLNFYKSILYCLTSYLTKRRQYLQINDKLSNNIMTSFGVPQGSILGPFCLICTLLPCKVTLMYRTLASSMLITRLYTNIVELMNWGNVSRLLGQQTLILFLIKPRLK